MDGYSVNEAAAVLGIPEGRVWELLARGVLAGSTEVGGDMRVILRGSAVPEAVTPAPAANGGHGTQGDTNGGSNGGELSAFRELLTEFRNLTERYGQALLALGEARGEVASLRGRVELLEARVELRLPRVEASMTAWESRSQPEPEPEPEVEAAVEPMPEPEVEAAAEPMPEPEPEVEAAAEPMPALPALELPEADASASDASATAQAPSEPSAAGSAEPPSPPPAAVARKRKRRTRRAPRSSHPNAPRPATSGSRLAMSGFAEALARAEDPATADVFTGGAPLPGADEAAEALAAYNQELSGQVMEPPATEGSASEPPSAETPRVPATMPVFVRPGYTTETPEPDWIAEEDLVVPVSRLPAAGEQTERAGAALAVADREADLDEQPAVDEEDAPDEQQAVEEAVDEEAMAEPEATIEELAEAVEVVAAVVATEDAEVEAVEGGRPVEGTTEPANHGTMGMPVTADEWAGPEADMVPEPVSEVDVRPEIAGEPPASDDDALLDALDRFSELPSVPNEPAFWEPEGRSRAPFAIRNLEGWEPAEIEALRAELRRFGTAAIPPTVAVGPASVTPPADVPPPEIAPPAAAVSSSAPRPSRPVPPSVSPAPPRRPRSPAARAVRRLRRLLG
jgi:hypothetical protein